jgi:hypothetical protein
MAGNLSGTAATLSWLSAAKLVRVDFEDCIQSWLPPWDGLVSTSSFRFLGRQHRAAKPEVSGLWFQRL